MNDATLIEKQDLGLSPGLTEWLHQHELVEEERKQLVDDRFLKTEEHMKLLATKEDIAGLATKVDTDELLRVFRAVKLGIQITSTGGKWGYRGFLMLATLLAAGAVIMGSIKGHASFISGFLDK